MKTNRTRPMTTTEAVALLGETMFSYYCSNPAVAESNASATYDVAQQQRCATLSRAALAMLFCAAHG